MDQGLFVDFFKEPRAFQSDLHGRTKTILVDNCIGHNLTPRLQAIFQAKHSVLRYLPPCSIHLYQLTDTFIVSKIKDVWTKHWKEKKTELIASNAWLNTARGDGQWSKKFTNPGKWFFLQLAADSIEDVNREVDCDNISYAQKAIIRSNMALDLDGTWSVHQLFPHLQELIAKHEPIFHGHHIPH